jgi:hypothetical protein
MTLATRISRLERRVSPEARAPRLFVAFVRADTEMQSAVLDGQWFNRTESESEDEFAARARAAAGWTDE